MLGEILHTFEIPGESKKKKKKKKNKTKQKKQTNKQTNKQKKNNNKQNKKHKHKQTKNKQKQNKNTKTKQTKTAIIGWELYFKNKKNLEQLICLYNGERMGMIDKGVPEICLFQ